jgi:acetylornithine/N-succinyldiaminopimelate aminotransferase
MKNSDVVKLYEKYVMNTYTRVPISLAKGKGSRVWDLEQNEYLDFFPGWGVSGLGHCPPKVVSHVKNQVKKIIHVSNNYYNHLQAKLAKMLIKISQIKGKVFFCNSGAEANESAFKLARAYGEGKRYKIITMQDSFHGRTLACISATGQKKYREGFEPLIPGFITVSFNDLSAIEKAIDKQTVAIMLELIQGEGGINVADKEYVKILRKICDEKDILLIIDEVQTGMGRTGKWFAYQNYDIIPDIITVAKTVAGGLPMGVMIAGSDISEYFKPGMHASTFGGSPLICKASLGVIDTIMKKKLLKNARDMGEYLEEKLAELKNKYKIIKEIRGIGLMLGVEVEEKGKEIYRKCFEKKLLINLTHENVIRIMPAINVKKKEIDKAVKILNEVLEEITK